MNLKKIVKTGLIIGGLVLAVNGFSEGNHEDYEVQPNQFAITESNQFYKLLEKAKGEVLPKPLSLMYGNEKLNISVGGIDPKFFIEIKKGKIIEVSNAIREDYTLDIQVKNMYTIFSIINSNDKIRQFNKARSDKDITINPRGLLNNVKLFFTQFY